MAETEFKHSYKLRCNLFGHSMDVRAIAVASNGDIVTASRDETARLWKESSENSCSYEEKVIYKGHSGYVNSVCLIPGNEESPEGFTATGSKDSTILIFPRNSPNPLHTLTGHSDAVSCLTWKEGMLVSGSWDNSIHVWKEWECVDKLKGHSGPIWSVAVMHVNGGGDCLILSASADKTLKCWKDGKNIVTYSGHTDCVRGLYVLNSEQFLSCSNDASVRMWSVSGECLATYYGHTSFIYSLNGIDSSGSFVTGGEDRSVRVWDSVGSNTHTIHVPAQSVWAVAALPNSDIVAGSSDGVCRVFTRFVDREADTEVQKEFEEKLASFKVSVEDVGGIKKSDLPDKTFLLTPGKRDGQTVMIKDGEKVLCYNWSASQGKWEAVGEVVGGAGGSANTSGKVLYLGREYDYVFDVDLDEGRVIKLPYNKGEDPWATAQAFIHEHELSQDYLDQVANFITTNANVSSQGSFGQSTYFDPFTGGSRYVPGAGSAPGTASGRGADPFTGSGRYVPSSSASFPSHQSTEPLRVSSQYFPQTVPLKFESINKAGILAKLQEANSQVANPLTEKQVESLVAAVVSPSVVVSDLSPLEKALEWSPERVWPVLDVLRLALRSEEAHKTWLGEGKGQGVVALLVGCLGKEAPLATQLLSLRCLANMASHDPGRRVLAQSVHSVLTSIASLSHFENKNIQIAIATLIINYATIFKADSDITDHSELLTAAVDVAGKITDPEAIFRIMVAFGTLISCCKDIKSLAQKLHIKPILEQFGTLGEPQKVAECARHVLQLL